MMKMFNKQRVPEGYFLSLKSLLYQSAYLSVSRQQHRYRRDWPPPPLVDLTQFARKVPTTSTQGATKGNDKAPLTQLNGYMYDVYFLRIRLQSAPEHKVPIWADLLPSCSVVLFRNVGTLPVTLASWPNLHSTNTSLSQKGRKHPNPPLHKIIRH